MNIEQSLNLIKDTLWQIKDKKDLGYCLEDLLTPSEIIEIANRIEILRQLKHGIPQRQIAQNLGVSITTVSRGNNILTYKGKAINKYI